MFLDESVYHCALDQAGVQPKKKRKGKQRRKDMRYHADLSIFPFAINNLSYLFPCCMDGPTLPLHIIVLA